MYFIECLLCSHCRYYHHNVHKRKEYHTYPLRAKKSSKFSFCNIFLHLPLLICFLASSMRTKKSFSVISVSSLFCDANFFNAFAAFLKSDSSLAMMLKAS